MAQTAATPASAKPGEAAGRGRGLLVAAVATLAGGLLVLLAAVLGGLSAGASIIGLLGADAIAAPSEATFDFDAGEYSVYQRADGTAVQLAPASISISGPSGDVTVRGAGPTETLSRGALVFESVARFTIEEAGRYTVRIQGSEATEVVIGPSLAAVLTSAVPWLVLVALGLLVALVGLGLLIAAMVRRRRPAPVASATPVPERAPPAGWYPDPAGGAARQRYWDGRAWTDYTA